jgi:metal-responsive CopG/Arc/MetJ family transcriptional regulator
MERKKRGRPVVTGTDPVTAMRLPPDLLAALDDWRRQQPDLPTRSEAIRRILRQALKFPKK